MSVEQEFLHTFTEYGLNRQAASQEVYVIGFGIIGAMSALALARAGFENITIFDAGGKTNTEAAGAQYLPLAFAPDGGPLPDQDQFIIDGYDRNYGTYKILAKDEAATGVRESALFEPYNAVNDWPAYLPGRMCARTITPLKPHTYLTEDGHVEDFPRTYAVPESFAITTPQLQGWLQRLCLDQPGVRRIRAKITHDMLPKIDGIIVEAAGPGALELTGDPTLRLVKGITATLAYAPGARPPEGSPLSMCSMADLLIIPHSDRVTIGSLYLNNPDSTEATPAELSRLIEATRHMAQQTIGDFRSMDPRTFCLDNIQKVHVGQRVVSPTGVCVDWDTAPSGTRILRADTAGGIGISIGPSIGDKVARLVVEESSALALP